MTCSKVSYATVFAARAALQAIQRRRDAANRVECAVYPCAEHHAFHLTSNRSAARNRWSSGR